MKKIFLAVLLLLALTSGTYGAVSEDTSVYVRQDVFDAKMEAMFVRLDSKIDALAAEVNGKINSLANEVNGKINSLANEVNGKFDSLTATMKGNFGELTARINGIEKRMDIMNTFLYYMLMLLGALLLLPIVNRLWESHEAKKQSPVTLEDVKRLIAEAKLNEMPQA